MVILGLSATAADIIPDVLAHAAHPVYASHRRGTMPFRRFRKGVPTDALVTWRRRQMNHSLQANFPEFARVMTDLAAGLFVRFTYPGLKPEWRMRPVPSLLLKLPSAVTFDNILPSLENGSLRSVHGIKRFVGPRQVELLDGVVLEDVDAVILCTGYSADFSVADEIVEASVPTAYGYDKDSEGGTPMYRLWMNMFPPRYADSVAMLCYSAFGKSNGFSFADVTSMAVSNVFRGVHPLPSKTAMDEWVDEHQKWIASRWKLEHTVNTSMVKQWEFQSFLHEAAGTGMESLSWMGWEGWKFWWKDPKMYDLMSNGIETAHMYRYFETGKRKTWDGARDAILKVAEESKRVLPISPEQEKAYLAKLPETQQNG